MMKVKNIYLIDEKELGNYATGLVLELEDGTFLAHCSTDIVAPFKVVEKPLSINH